MLEFLLFHLGLAIMDCREETILYLLEKIFVVIKERKQSLSIKIALQKLNIKLFIRDLLFVSQLVIDVFKLMQAYGRVSLPEWLHV